MKNILGEGLGGDGKKKEDSTLLNESNYYCAYNPNLHKKKTKESSAGGGSRYLTNTNNTLKVKEY
jgi:hypothetical protein